MQDILDDRGVEVVIGRELGTWPELAEKFPKSVMLNVNAY